MGNAKYTWVLWVLAICIVAIVVGITCRKVDSEYTETRVQHVTDSLCVIRSADSMAYASEIHVLDSQYRVSLMTAESLSTQLAIRQTSNKTYIKTVYKDSIREVYIDNHEYTLNYDNTVKHITDSLAETMVHRVDTVTIYVDRVTRDTVVVTHSQDDSVAVTKTETSKGRTFAIFAEANGIYDIQDGVGVEGVAGAKWFFAGPLYAKGAVRFDGDIGGEVGVGLELSF